MGRWAQQRRRGTGATAAAPAPSIVVVSVVVDTSSQNAIVQFSANVSAASFGALDLNVDTPFGSFASTGAAQDAADTIAFSGPADWALADNGDTWDLNTTAPGVVSPQNGTYLAF